MSQLENMIMQKTDYSIPDSLGIVMTFKYDDVNLLDFDRLQELHDIGYNRTLNMMDSIKSRVHRRVNADNVRLRRLVFRSNLPQFRFRDIIIEGANAQQQAYIKKEFHDEEHEVFTYEDLKRGYFRLLADNMISVTNHEQKVLKEVVMELYADYISDTQTQYPLLTDEDLLYLCLEKAGFSYQTIALCFGNTTTHVVAQRKYRIKERMNESK